MNPKSLFQSTALVQLALLLIFALYAHPLLAQIPFTTPQIVTNAEMDGTTAPRELVHGDIDSDGDLDIILAVSNYSGDDNGKVVWHENFGSNIFGPSKVLFAHERATNVVVGDFDADGDTDIACLGITGDLSWYQNDGSGMFSLGEFIAYIGTSATNLITADLDADGDLDLVSCGIFGGTIIHENLGAGDFTYGTQIDPEKAYNLDIGDMDNDGDLDIVHTAIFGVWWFENLGSLNFSTAKNIENYYQNAKLGDFDNDNDLDLVVIKSSDAVRVIENLGSGLFGPATAISPVGTNYDVTVTDVDMDGKIDILTSGNYGSEGAVIYFNLGSTFAAGTNVPTVPNGLALIAVEDTDGDGDQELFTSESATFQLNHYENTGGGFGPRTTLNSLVFGAASTVFADMDGDGDADILAADGYSAWFENDGTGEYIQAHNIVQQHILASKALAVDLDNDNDLDVVTEGYATIHISFNDGLGNFGASVVLYDDVRLRDIATADTDNDGDQEIIGVLRRNSGKDSLFIFENQGGGVFSDYKVVYNTLTSPRQIQSISTADLNQDGLEDIVITNNFPDEVFWIKNLGANNFSLKKLIGSGLLAIRSVRTADLNNDAKQDVVTTSFAGVHWFENTGGAFGASTLVSDVSNASFAVGADIDNDGDIDLFSLSEQSKKVFWHKNLGTGSFGSRKLISSGENNLKTLASADADGDGFPELATGGFGDHIYIYKNLLGPTCSSISPPANPNSVLTASTVDLSWDPISGSVGCQLRGTRVSPPGPTSFRTFPGSELSSMSFPLAPFGGPGTWEWSVRCVCELGSTIDATPFSVTDTFSISSLRTSALSSEVLIAPNPATTKVTISLPSNGHTKIEITDLLGRVWYQSVDRDLELQQLKIDVKDWQAGLYFFTAEVDGVVHQGRFKKH